MGNEPRGYSATEAYWRLARYYPNDTRFHAEYFAWQPAELIDRAIFEYEKIDREQLHHQERPIAQLANLLYSVNRDPNKSRPRTLNDWCLYAPPKEDGPTMNAAIAFTQLASAGRLPQDLLTSELMEEMADKVGKMSMDDIAAKSVAGIRCLFSDRLTLFACKVGSGIEAEYAILEEGEMGEVVTLRDLDSEDVYRVSIEQEQGAYLNGTDAWFTLVEGAEE